MVGDYFSGEASIAYGFGQPLSSKKILPSLLFPSFLSRCFSRSKTPFSVVLSIAVVPRFGGRTLVNTSESNDLLCRVSCMCVCVCVWVILKTAGRHSRFWTSRIKTYARCQHLISETCKFSLINLTHEGYTSNPIDRSSADSDPGLDCCLRYGCFYGSVWMESSVGGRLVDPGFL